MENNNEKENILAELREVLMHGDFDLNQIEAIIRANEGLDLEELKKSLEKYKSYTKKYQETSELLDTYNTVMKEEMDSLVKNLLLDDEI